VTTMGTPVALPALGRALARVVAKGALEVEALACRWLSGRAFRVRHRRAPFD